MTGKTKYKAPELINDLISSGTLLWEENQFKTSICSCNASETGTLEYIGVRYERLP